MRSQTMLIGSADYLLNASTTRYIQFCFPYFSLACLQLLPPVVGLMLKMMVQRRRCCKGQIPEQ